jgi:hypothetical protein
MTKLKLTLIFATVAISTAIALFIHQNARVKMRENEAALRQQESQLNQLLADQQRLSNQVAAAKHSTNSQLSELTRLRNQAQALQAQTNKLGIQVKSNRQLRASQRFVAPEPRPPEYYKELFRVAGAKPIDGRNLSTAFAMYASDHQGRFPSSLDQVAKYLAQYPLSGTNEFDIIYRGSLDELKGIPRGSVVVIRERQTWIAPSGKRARVYGMADGRSEIIESDDDFKAWEAEHIISSSPARR